VRLAFDAGSGSVTPSGVDTDADRKAEEPGPYSPLTTMVTEPLGGSTGTVPWRLPDATAIDVGQLAPPLEPVQEAVTPVDSTGGIAATDAPSAESGPALVITTV
jgi:hypothetical protein